MAHQSTSITCLSTEDHHENVSNHLVHYFGCLRIKPAVHENGKISIGRDDFKNKAQKEVNEDIQREINRIDFLRATLDSDELDGHLVKCLAKSLGEWRSAVRRRNNTSTSEPEASPEDRGTAETSSHTYDLERDVKVPIIHYYNGEGRSLEDLRIWGTFPSQKTNLKYLLTDDDTPPNGGKLLQRKVSPRGDTPREITYFHIPYNNMTVSHSYYMMSRPVTKMSAVGRGLYIVYRME